MPKPTFTIVIPTFNRLEKLRSCLASINAQTLPKAEFEVVVVFDDDSVEIDAQAITATCPDVQVRVVCQPHRGPAAARNHGAGIAKGRYLAFTDDDCQPTPDWLLRLAQHLDQTEDTALVGGRVINVLKNNIYAAASQSLVDFLYTYFNEPNTQAQLLTSNNFCVPAKFFRAMGGFDETFRKAGGEDRELCLRWRHHGYRLIYARDVVVEHLHDMTFACFLRQHLTYGEGGWHLHECAERCGYGPIRLEPMNFYRRLLLYPLQADDTTQKRRTTLLFAISQAATGVGYFRARLRSHMGTK